MKNIEKPYLTTSDTDMLELNRNVLNSTLPTNISIAFFAQDPYINTDMLELNRNTFNSTLPTDISIAFYAQVPYINSESISVIFVKTLEEANKLSNESVRKQTIEALYAIIHCLQTKSISSRRLPKPSLTENDDGSSLLEWNFEKFRIGLYFEQDESKSFYFFVQRDDSVGLSDSWSRRINGEIKSVVASLVNFIVDNT